MLLFWVQFLSACPIEEASLFGLAIFGPTVLISNYLSNHLLPIALVRKKMSRFIIQFILCSLFVALIHTIVYFCFAWLEQTGYFAKSELLPAHAQSFIFEFITSTPAPITINLGFCGLRFYYEHTKLEKVHLKAQLQILQQQINPHFMFNVLNHIHILMQRDVELASYLLVKYSDILRYQLYNGKNELVPLGQEIQFLKDVVEVEKIRWGNELKVCCEWNVENSEREIQPLLLITFVENAFKHVSRSISEKGYININLEQKGNTIDMKVENSKSKQIVKKKSASGIGLKNIKERLEILYPAQYRLDIAENEDIYSIQLNISLN